MSLPHEVLVSVFCFLGNTQDLARVKLVCKNYCIVAADESIWKQLAIRKYGLLIHNQTIRLYHNSSYEMLKDDNRLGACPTLYNPGLCLYKYNRPDYWFGCLIRWVKWHRLSHTVHVFIDARGESDLRQPITSGLWRDRFGQLDLNRMSLPAVSYTPVVQQSGHYKGVLIYPDIFFTEPGEYVFCYANSGRRRDQMHHDYSESIMLRVLSELKHSFPDYSLAVFIDDDTDQSDRQRWGEHVPKQVLERQNGSWWV